MYKIKINNPVIVTNFITNAPVLNDKKEVLNLDFKTFVKTIIYTDARWDLSLASIKCY